MLRTKAYHLSDLQKTKVKIDIKRLIDENNVLKRESQLQSVNQIYFTLQLVSYSDMFAPKKYSKNYPQKLEFNESIIFQCSYEDLSIDSRIAVTIWSLEKKLDDKKPLGSTVISVFDENDCLRQGKYHLFVWPNILPDFFVPTTTPGLVDDPNIQTLNFVSEMKQNLPKLHIHDQLTQEALNIKLYDSYRLISAAFLEIQFPKFPQPVLYQDKIALQYEDFSLQETFQTDFNDCFQIYDPDYEANRVDPIEDFFYFIKSERQISPKREELQIIDSIVQKTFRADNLKSEQKELFFKYRYYLSQNKKYLLYFLHSVRWGTHEQNEAIKLLQTWQKIDLSDALNLLSRQFAANSLYNKKKVRSDKSFIGLRNYVTNIISNADLSTLFPLLFQLVQTIKYDSVGESLMSKLIISKSLVNDQFAILAYWYLNAESQTNNSASKQEQISNGKNLKAETVKIYRNVFVQFCKQLKEKSPEIWYKIYQQEKFIKFLRKLSKIIKGTRKKQRDIQYKRRLGQVNWEQFGPICFPLDYNIVLKSPVINSCSIFRTATAPFKLVFQLQAGGVYQFIYKEDDLRQDQLILEMFGLMDKILKGANQDYKLTPYKALACSKSDGFVEFVPKTKTFIAVDLKHYVQDLIKKKSDAVMENYLLSTAGYCAMTYFFIIGDRHPQNLMIDQEGKIFHIDFSFILGRDPKPYPPSIKISKQMIDAMGVSELQIQQNFSKFKLKCLEAYSCLRKQAKWFYNLSVLMLDSGIKDVNIQGLSKLYDKFSMNYNDTEAERNFLVILEDCVMLQKIPAKILTWTSYCR